MGEYDWNQMKVWAGWNFSSRFFVKKLAQKNIAIAKNTKYQGSKISKSKKTPLLLFYLLRRLQTINKNDKYISGYSTKHYNTLSLQIWIKASAVVIIIFPYIEKFGMHSKARPSISPNLLWTVHIFFSMTKTFGFRSKNI